MIVGFSLCSQTVHDTVVYKIPQFAYNKVNTGMDSVRKQYERQPKCVSIESFISFSEFLRVIFVFDLRVSKESQPS